MVNKEALQEIKKYNFTKFSWKFRINFCEMATKTFANSQN